MTRILSDTDLAALLAVRSVLADAAGSGHMAAPLALAVLDRLAETGNERVINGCTVNVHVYADDFATTCGCGNTTSGPPVVPARRAAEPSAAHEPVAAGAFEKCPACFSMRCMWSDLGGIWECASCRRLWTHEQIAAACSGTLRVEPYRPI